MSRVFEGEPPAPSTGRRAETSALRAGKPCPSVWKTLVLHGKTLALRVETLALRGKTLALRGKTLALHGKTLVLHGKTLALHGKTLAPAPYGGRGGRGGGGEEAGRRRGRGPNGDKGGRGVGMADYLLKVVVVGPSGSGKSALVHRFADNEFNEVGAGPTVGMGISIRTMTVMGTSVRCKVMVHDMSGQAKFENLARSHCASANAIIVVRDPHGETAAAAAHAWFKLARECAQADTLVYSVETKADLAPGPAEDGKWRVSAKTGDNVNALFTDIIMALSYRSRSVDTRALAQTALARSDAASPAEDLMEEGEAIKSYKRCCGCFY
jgi:signal recognition particle receptor subunit beta